MIKLPVFRLGVFPALLLLSSCVSFLPTYDQEVHGQLRSAVDEINKIGTVVSLPYRKATFDEVESYYIAAFSHLTAAEETASFREGGLAGRVSARSAAIVREAIQNCQRALETLRDLHRTEGIDATDFADSSVRRTCTIPAMMEERLQR
jgi:hypothetical protein